MPPSSPTKVLVVDDSAVMRRAITEILRTGGEFDVHIARNGPEALVQVDRLHPDVITLDVTMPEMDGLACLTRIMARWPTPVVMVSSLTEHNAMVTLEALELGAVDFVPKPSGTLRAVAAEIVRKVRDAASAHPRRSGGSPAHLEAPRSARTGEVDLVLIGASTGGPARLAELLPSLPAGLGAPVVVAQHIPAAFTGPLARRLDGLCELRVFEVDRIETLSRGSIYLARGSADVVVARRPGGLVVKSVPASADYRWHPSVDRLVGSARRYCDPSRMVCVLLTGMGDDGAAEMAAVHAGGGRTIAESPETAVVWGMPGELTRRGGATEVLPSYDIAGRLAEWVR